MAQPEGSSDGGRPSGVRQPARLPAGPDSRAQQRRSRPEDSLGGSRWALSPWHRVIVILGMARSDRAFQVTLDQPVGANLWSYHEAFSYECLTLLHPAPWIAIYPTWVNVSSYNPVFNLSVNPLCATKAAFQLGLPHWSILGQYDPGSLTHFHPTQQIFVIISVNRTQ